MRIALIGRTSCALVILASTSVAGPRTHPPGEIMAKPLGPPQANREMTQPPPAKSVGDMTKWRDMLTGDPARAAEPFAPPSLETEKELAGLSRGSRPALLTWDRVYALAVVRARSRRGAYLDSLDPAALVAEAAQDGFADFAQFAMLLVAASPFSSDLAFRDPSAAVLELLRRRQTIENARMNAAIHEALEKWTRDIAKGESGLDQLDADLVRDSLDRARRRVADETGQYRDELDKLKIALGLRPRAAVILDRQNIDAFRAGFGALASWHRNAQRSREELHGLIERLPGLGEVILGGQPILAKIEINPDNGEDVLTTAVQLAIKNRADRDRYRATMDSGVQLELRIRRRIRGLSDTRRAYKAAKGEYEMAERLYDQMFERLFAATAHVISSRAIVLQRTIEQLDRVLAAKDRLITLWVSFRTERLALYRDVGALPYDDFKSFYDDLSAGPAAASAVPPALPQPAGAAPSPPAPLVAPRAD
jgi:hypothetical protein